jgi:hypothetical protein
LADRLAVVGGSWKFLIHEKLELLSELGRKKNT